MTRTKTRTKKINKKIKTIIKLLKQNKSLSEIGQVLGMSKQGVWWYIQHYQIQVKIKVIKGVGEAGIHKCISTHNG
jgi:biotin operon repressor